MARRGAIVLLLAANAFAAAAVPPPKGDALRADAGRARAVERTWERYREIVGRNIFSRDRRAYTPSVAGASEGGAASRDAASAASDAAKAGDRSGRWVLMGVSKVGDSLLAFFEDSDGTLVQHARQGETIGTCTLKAISLDNVTVRVEDKERTISVGYTLAGEVAAVRAPAETSDRRPSRERGERAAGAVPAAATPASPGAAPAAEDGSVLERLLRRRQQEMSGGGS